MFIVVSGRNYDKQKSGVNQPGCVTRVATNTNFE